MWENDRFPEVQLGNMINLNQKLVGSPVEVLFRQDLFRVVGEMGRL